MDPSLSKERKSLIISNCPFNQSAMSSWPAHFQHVCWRETGSNWSNHCYPDNKSLKDNNYKGSKTCLNTTQYKLRVKLSCKHELYCHFTACVALCKTQQTHAHNYSSFSQHKRYNKLIFQLKTTWAWNERMSRHARVTRKTNRVAKKTNLTFSGVERNKEADYEQECLESDGLPNTGTIA